MRIRTYDEIEPFEAFRLSSLAFGFAWTEEVVRRVRQRDRRYLDGFALYAEERGRALAQVVPMRFHVRLTTGVEEVGGLAGVCSHPGFWGRGYARVLMDAAHDRFRELGFRVSTLTTSRNIRGYGVYARMGYVELGPFYRGVRRVGRRSRPEGFRLTNVTVRDLPTVHALYRTQTRGLLGWTERHPEQIAWALARNRDVLSRYRVVRRDGRIVAYLRTRPEDQVTMEEVVAPDRRSFRASVALMEARASKGITTVNWITAAKDAARFRATGYAVDGPIADTTMALSLTRGLRTRELPRRFGADSGRFVQYPTDDF